jgi:hypothetical protein
MKALVHTAVVVTAAIALGGCPDKRPEPVPGPQSSPAKTPSSGMAHESSTPGRGQGVSEISWFQGTLEEAFSRRTCSERRSWLHL